MIEMYNQKDPSQGFMVAYPGGIEGFNAFKALSLRTFFVEMLLYDSLVVYDKDLNVIPWLAEEYTISADGLDYAFEIRDDVYWHDGKKLTADDVLWNFAYRYDNEVANTWSWIKYIDRETLRVEDDTVMFSLTEANSWFILRLYLLKVIPQHTYPDGQEYTTWEDPNPIGSGPFTFDSYVPDQTIKVVKNPNWWYTRPETITTPTTLITTVTGTVTSVITSIVPELNGGIWVVPVVMLVFALMYLHRKRKTK